LDRSHLPLISTVFVALLLAARLPSLGAETAPAPLGYLATSGSVEVKALADGISLPVSEYTYFSGEQIVTAPASSAVLTLDDGIVLIGPDTVVSASGRVGDYVVDVSRGEVRVRFSQAGDFQIASHGVKVRPAPSAGPAAAGKVDALLKTQADGVVLVQSREGALEVTTFDGLPPVELAPGESVSFHAQGWRRTTPVQESSLRDSKLWRAAPWLGGALAAGGVAGGVIAITGGDDNGDASPVQ
jgi:ferric-dicitrate binding protein FerR (iron transport regulator)